MEILVKKIEVGAKYQNDVYNWWITGETINGNSIYLFDPDSIIISRDIKIDEVINCQLSLSGSVTSRGEVAEYGEVIKFKIISKVEASLPNISKFIVQTELGIIYIPFDDEMEKIYCSNDDKTGYYNYTRIDIIDIDELTQH